MGQSDSKIAPHRTDSDAERSMRYKKTPSSHKSIDIQTVLALRGNVPSDTKDKINTAKKTNFLDLEGYMLHNIPQEITEQCASLATLNLSRNLISEIPARMSKLTSLGVLRLNTNALTECPAEVLHAYTNMQLLDLSRNNFTEIPSGISAMTRLGRLEMHCNRVATVNGTLSHLNELQVVDLSTNNFESLPQALAQCTSLRILDLNNNQLRTLKGIGNLTHLGQLLIAANKLTELPDEICDLTFIKDADMSTNLLHSIPAKVYNWGLLSKLNLSGNRFVTFPVELVKIPRTHIASRSELILTELINLDLSNNQITILPPQVSQLYELSRFNISKNHLIALPPEIGKMTVLEMLDVTENKITVLPPEIGKLEFLSQLYIAKNDISVLPTEIGQMKCLNEFDAVRNRITSVPASIGQLTQLRKLSLAVNKLSALPTEVGLLTKLVELDLHTNELRELPSSCSALVMLEFLNLYQNKLTAVPAWFNNMRTLGALLLGYNAIETLPDKLSGMLKLEELFLNGNKLAAIPAAITELLCLQELFVARNQLKELPTALTALKALKVVDASVNHIESFPSFLSSVGTLRELNLSGNSISAVPDQVKSFTQLKELYLSFNRISKLPEGLDQALPGVILSLQGNETRLTKRVGIAEMLGRRQTMEDTVAVKIGVQNKDMVVDVFGVFDGHGGRDAALLVSQHAASVVQRRLGRGSLADTAMEAMLDLSELTANQLSGLTAVLAVVGHGGLAVANCGDSRAVVSRAGVAVQVSFDHTPRLPEEEARIRALGGFVTGGRVNGLLAVARTLGDKMLHPYVRADPFVHTQEVTASDEFLIIACDGVWDVTTNQQAVDLVRAEAADHPQLAALRLRDHAYLCGSSDNITAVVVPLHPLPSA